MAPTPGLTQPPAHLPSHQSHLHSTNVVPHSISNPRFNIPFEDGILVFSSPYNEIYHSGSSVTPPEIIFRDKDHG
jgi:hypothetical protein